MLPLTGRITLTEQVIKMTVMDFIFADIFHFSNLFAQITFDRQNL